MKAKIAITLGLLGLAAGGFYIATQKTNGGKGTTPGSGLPSYQVQIIPHRDGGYAGVVVIDGVVADDTIGPRATVTELEIDIANYMANLDVAAFYTLAQDSSGAYFFDGWSRGSKVAPHQGPYASEQIAMQAGSEWAKRTAAVPFPSEVG